MNLRNVSAIILVGSFLLAAADILGHASHERIPSQHFDHTQVVSSGTNVKKRRLVFIGTVSRIYPVGPVGSRRNWAVVTEVDRVVSGDFSGATFTFTVHSPARMGLQVGLAYTFEAVWNNGKYVVEDTKWMKPVDGHPRK